VQVNLGGISCPNEKGLLKPQGIFVPEFQSHSAKSSYVRLKKRSASFFTAEILVEL